MGKPDFEITLGVLVQDKVTGFKGITLGRTEWLHGCRRYVIQPRELIDGKVVDALSFDEDSIDVLDTTPAVSPPDARAFKYELGAKAKDAITEYEGTIVGRTEWLHSGLRYHLQSRNMDKGKGKPIEQHCIEEGSVILLSDPAYEHNPKRREGGPSDATASQRTADPSR